MTGASTELAPQPSSPASTASGSAPTPNLHYTGMTHKASQPFEDGIFDGDENAIVDFKYSSSPRVTWWFDHHQSAFLTPADAAHFRADRSGKKFYDPTYKSCTKFLADDRIRKIWFRCAAAGRADSLGRRHRRRAISHAGIGGRSRRAGHAACARNRSRARTRIWCRKLIPELAHRSLGGDGEAADRGEAPGAASRAAPALDGSHARARAGDATA